MRKDSLKKYVVAIAAALIFIGCVPCSAETVYIDNSYTYNDSAEAVPDKEIYEAVLSVNGKQAGTTAFNRPEDIAVYAGRVYLADTGNDRIVVLDGNLDYIKEIATVEINGKKDSLYTPTGLFVSDAGILVCDQGSKRVLLMDENGKVSHVYEKPDIETLSNITFKPNKVVMDSFHNVYVLAEGVYQGFLLYSADGEFIGFYGSNVIESTLSVKVSRFWKSIFNQSASESMTRDISAEYSNAYIDADGFIYATIYQTSTNTNNLKKLNVLGNNILKHDSESDEIDRNKYGDQETYLYEGVEWKPNLVDVTVDESGIISVLDSTWGRVFQYNQDGDIVGIFGGLGNSLGTFSAPTAIERLNDNYLVVDQIKGTITMFEPTLYRQLLGQALKYYSQGEYQRSIELWQTVLKYNSNILLAYKSIGKAYLQQGDLEEAADCLKIAGDRQSYSMALGQLRQLFFKKHLLLIVLGIIAFWFLLKYSLRGIKKWMGFSVKKRRKRLPDQ